MNAREDNDLNPFPGELQRELRANERTLQSEFIKLQISRLYQCLKLVYQLIISLLLFLGKVSEPLLPMIAVVQSRPWRKRSPASCAISPTSVA